jgi:RNA polymerase sigma-70 factor (sigma-E family)
MDWLDRRGARRQFEEFVAGSAAGLARTAYLMTWDLAESEDLVQETLLRVARRWDRVRTMEHPLGYARRILVNLALDGSRRRRRERDELTLPDAAFGALADDRAAGALGAVDAADELQRALRDLPRQERAVMVLRYWDDLSEREIARILGCSLGTVKKTAWRGVQRLRRQLRADVDPTGDAEPPIRAAELVTVPDDEGSAL